MTTFVPPSSLRALPYSLNCAGVLLSLDEPRIMGILNLTPDSFYEHSRTASETLLARAEAMLEEGANIIDIGGVSTRPDALPVSEAEEMRRLMPAFSAISLIKQRFPAAIVSIDTFRASVARTAVAAGAGMINDVSGGRQDADMFRTVAELGVPYLLMHSRQNPQTMQNAPHYSNVVTEVFDELNTKITELRQLGVRDIIADVGFGFAKTLEHNYTLLRHLAAFETLGCPLLVGISRKSMIYRLLGVSPEEALNGTSALHFAALTNGAHLLRVHDVRQAREVVQVWQAYNA